MTVEDWKVVGDAVANGGCSQEVWDALSRLREREAGLHEVEDKYHDRVLELMARVARLGEGIDYIRKAAQSQFDDPIKKTGWISAAWVEDACDRISPFPTPKMEELH